MGRSLCKSRHFTALLFSNTLSLFFSSYYTFSISSLNYSFPLLFFFSFFFSHLQSFFLEHFLCCRRFFFSFFHGKLYYSHSVHNSQRTIVFLSQLYSLHFLCTLSFIIYVDNFPCNFLLEPLCKYFITFTQQL